MATAMEYTKEQLNYYRICYVATNVLTQGLRTIFKQEWDNRYKTTLGEWKDEPRNGLDFRNRESPRNQRRNAHLLVTMVKGNRAEWDCTMLFYAILYSDCIHGLSPVVRSNVDDLRKFRNEVIANKGLLSDVQFQNVITKVETAFQALGLSTLHIQGIKNQTSFPTEELRYVVKKDNNLKEDLQEIEEQRQVLEDQLSSDISPFCVLPPKPSHDVAGRDLEVAEITQQLKELKRANENNLSYLYISGNPGSGKSQLARLVAKRFFHEVKDPPYATSFVMTVNAESPDTLLESYVAFSWYLKCSEYAVTNILNSKDLTTDEKITNLKTLIGTKIELCTSWLLVVDNVESISRVRAHLPEPGNEQWASCQLLITTQDDFSIPLTSSFIGHISVSEGMHPDDARSLLAKLSGITDSEMVNEVAKALDYQPLALVGAATYVKQVRQSKIASNFSWNHYLQKLEKGQRSTTEKFLAETNPSYPKSMTTVTRLAIEKAMRLDKVIYHTFNFLSFCAPQPLLLDIIVNYILGVDKEIEDKEVISMKIRRCSLLLLKEEESGIYIRVHKIVLDIIINDFPFLDERLRETVNAAVKSFSQYIEDRSDVVDIKHIVPHLKTLIMRSERLFSKEHINQATQNSLSNIQHSFQVLGQICQERCELHAAEKYFNLALQFSERSKTGQGEDLADVHFHMGRVSAALGKFNQAKKHHENELAIRLNEQGAEHVDVAYAYNNLGNVHSRLGDLEQAREYHFRALDIQIKKLGPEHVKVATTWTNLGIVFSAIGDLEQAKDYHTRALDIRLKTLGLENVKVATSYNNLGTVYSTIGDLKQAKEYYHRASIILLNKEETEQAHVAASDMYNDLNNLPTTQSVPPYILARGIAAKAAYHRALETGKTSDKRVKILLVGQDRVGKTSVARSLKGEPFRKDESSTEGVQIDTPLKHVGEKPWKNSKEEQEKTAFHHNCALHITNQLLTEPPKPIYEENAVGTQTETYEAQMTESMVGEMGLNQEFPNDALHGSEVGPKSVPKHPPNHDSPHDVEPKSYVKSDEISSIRPGDNRPNEKRKNDIPDEITKLTTENLLKKQPESDDGIWPVFMDFAGQAIYRAIHPIFVSREAVYVLVVDLTKNLSARARCCVKEPEHDEREIEPPDRNDTNLDHIMRWMDVVHSFKHEENDKILPPVILVGTHADLVQGDANIEITNVKDIICDTASDFSHHIIGKTFAVNNTLAGKELDEEDPKIRALRQEILKVGDTMPHTRDKVPLKWLQVEDEVYDLASKGTNYVTRQDFKKNICDDICQFEVQSDFEVLLNFLHDRGTVVYHGSAEDPGSLVVLNPKWLIDVLCQIITVEKQKEEETLIRNLREGLGRDGILDTKLLDDSCKQLGVGDIKESLVFIMKKFNLLCECTSKGGKSVYLVPCMLTSKPDNELMSDNSANQGSAPVYVTFSTQYVPGGLFSRLIVLFVEFVQMRITCVQPQLRANFARFFIGRFTGIEFVCYKRVIKVRLWDLSNPNSDYDVLTEPKVCSEVLSFLKASLKRLREECHWLQTVSWDISARCNLCPPLLQFVRKTGECWWHGEKECRHDDCAHYVSLTEVPVCCSRSNGPNYRPVKTWSQALEDATCRSQGGKFWEGLDFVAAFYFTGDPSSKLPAVIDNMMR